MRWWGDECIFYLLVTIVEKRHLPSVSIFYSTLDDGWLTRFNPEDDEGPMLPLHSDLTEETAWPTKRYIAQDLFHKCWRNWRYKQRYKRRYKRNVVAVSTEGRQYPSGVSKQALSSKYSSTWLQLPSVPQPSHLLAAIPPSCLAPSWLSVFITMAVDSIVGCAVGLAGIGRSMPALSWWGGNLGVHFWTLVVLRSKGNTIVHKTLRKKQWQLHLTKLTNKKGDTKNSQKKHTTDCWVVASCRMQCKRWYKRGNK